MVSIKPHKIERSRRKTIGLFVTPDGNLIIKAPIFATKQDIDIIIKKKERWIKRKIEKTSQIAPTAVHEFVNGEGFLFLGKMYRLKIGKYQSVTLGNYLFFPKSQVRKKVEYETLINWYKKQALKKITSRTNWYTKKMGTTANVRLSDARKRLGSRGRNNDLLMNWRLIMAPLPIIDYIIVHELAHREEKNHSKKFWSIIKIVLPDYENAKVWIKHNGHLLNI